MIIHVKDAYRAVSMSSGGPAGRRAGGPPPTMLYWYIAVNNTHSTHNNTYRAVLGAVETAGGRPAAFHNTTLVQYDCNGITSCTV